jgi:multisubunit Na+/H+ antiporter MnhF subunit
VAAEAVFVASVSAIAILSVLLDAPLLLDVALVAVLVGFLTTIGLSHFVDRTEDRT